VRVRVFVLNTGSSSLKYRLIETETGSVVSADLIERVSDHAAALTTALERIGGERIDCVAHRVVHGGERFTEPVVVDDAIVAELRDLSVLAPLHNPINVLGIELARRALPDVPNVAVFDTAFHATLPPHAYTYAVPAGWGVRRYGFHGTSNAHVSRAAAKLLGREPGETNLIVLHLGNGASATAIEGGRSVDTSMGLTPLEGLVMGTRSGDVDPSLVDFRRRAAGIEAEETERLLNTASGLLALAGVSDMRELLARDDADAALALDVYCYRIRKYVGAYRAVLGRVDAIVFTAGVGEHAATIRAKALDGLFGLVVDPERNQANASFISPPGAEIAVLVVPTDEELEIATQAAALV
jgi:acetate kinase